MNEITNKHLLTTMIIIGVITIALIVSGYRTTAPYPYSYSNSAPLQASVYSDSDYYYQANSPRVYTLGTRSQVYVPVITRTYTTPTTVYSTPAQSTHYTYTTSSYLPDETGYNGGYYYGDQGYTPPGCEGGTDYSTTTFEPCG